MFNNSSVKYSMNICVAGLAERTEILHGTKDILDAQMRFFSNARGRIDICTDYYLCITCIDEQKY